MTEKYKNVTVAFSGGEDDYLILDEKEGEALDRAIKPHVRFIKIPRTKGGYYRINLDNVIFTYPTPK